ncbi:MAG: citrate synthase [Caulobacteraceae bacterium]|nr:citrate synthase [Caulobacteraceae bacterium]
MTEWLGAAETLERLGVRPQTLYAYVSRGRIEARADPADPRRSLYRAQDVARLAARKARGRKAAVVAEEAIAWGEPVLASAITTVADGRLYYRGRDATELARSWTLEQAARLLCDGYGTVVKSPAASPWGAAASPRERAFAFLARRAARDAPSRGRAPSALASEAASVLDGLADAVAGLSGEAVLDAPIHVRLAAAWRCDAAGADVIRRALVLLADHELNASTFAARVAASTGGSLAAAALAGMAALSGPLHGGMGLRVEVFMAEARRDGAAAAVGARIAQGLPIPGFGHPLYPRGDPRALALLETLKPDPLFEAVRAAAEAQTGGFANIDFALTAMAAQLRLPPDAAFLLFAMGRCAGWLAHALEQISGGQLIRPRARYAGPPIRAG